MAKGWVDFRLVKERVSMQMVLDHYQMNWLRKNGNELRGRCPIHKGDGGRTFHANVSKNVFKCFSCGKQGNVLDLVAALEGCTVREAGQKLSDWFGVGESNHPAVHTAKSASRQASTGEQVETKAGRQVNASTAGAQVTEEGPKQINPPLRFQLRMDSDHEYGLGRRLSKETLEYFGAGFCRSKGMFAGRFLIPLHNEAGELVGYAGRSIDEAEPKYLFPAGAKGFHKSHLVYNLHRVAALSVDTAILVEGFFSVMWLCQAGLPAAVGLLGSELSAEQEGMLCRHFSRALLLFDGDQAGRSATEDCLQRLSRSMWVKSIRLPDGVQPDDLSSEEISLLVKSAQ